MAALPGPARFAVGIDLGTSNTVLAYAALPPDGKGPPGPVTLFEINQLVAPGQVAPLPLLPSTRYHAAPGELAPADVQYFTAPGAQDAPVVVGTFARKLGAQAPGRVVASAKSWLSHPGVDRLAAILPWGSPAEVPKVSPVEASASYLAYLREAWNARFTDAPLEQQDIVLTVPASFDEAARALTLQAARMAGLPHLRLLEEPQAVFYDWLARHRGNYADELKESRLVLVCDVGGGTTDLSLIEVEAGEHAPLITRVGVGKHLILGGDNMDLALAHLVEARLAGGQSDGQPNQRLSAAQFSQLVERCRAAKEQLLADDAPQQVTVTLLGAGARLIGAARSAALTRREVEQLVLDGFMPQVEASAPLQTGRVGIVEFGLPYARDPAITRHIADFLRRHADAAPDTLLLNGGVFHAPAMGARLQQTLGAWRGQPLHLLHNDNPDLAVARGAVAYALTSLGQTPTIGGGAARSYFLLLGGSAPDTQSAICILPRASQAGIEQRLEGRQFALRVGEPVRFHLLTSNADLRGRAPFTAGELVELTDAEFDRLPPLASVLPASSGDAARRQVPVQLATQLSEVGTLEVRCVSVDDPARRWLLEFDLRQQELPDTAPDNAGVHPARLAQAMAKVERVFGPKAQGVAPKEVKGLRAALEASLGERASWNMALLRQLADALLGYARARRRSADHERVWLNLTGYCLRPGYGAALDAWRIEQLWALFEAGVVHHGDRQVRAEWWTLWRRVAGGLDGEQQRRLLDDFAFNLEANQQGRAEKGGAVVRGSDEDMLRLGSSLERIPPAYKEEIGQWLLGRLGAAGDPLALSALNLWALGRLGARTPVYGNIDDVVAPEVVAAWLESVLALNWRKVDGAAFAAASLARVTGDRARDLPLALRESVAARLRQVGAPPLWARMVGEVVTLDEATERLVLGETLPPGLRLIA